MPALWRSLNAGPNGGPRSPKHIGETALFREANGSPPDRRMLKAVLLVAGLEVSRRDQHRNDECPLPIAASCHRYHEEASSPGESALGDRIHCRQESLLLLSTSRKRP